MLFHLAPLLSCLTVSFSHWDSPFYNYFTMGFILYCGYISTSFYPLFFISSSISPSVRPIPNIYYPFPQLPFPSLSVIQANSISATTHTDLTLRARESGIQTRIIHNASIINAVSSCGLQLYNFGQVVSVPFFTENWRPSSFYSRIKENLDLGLHTLVLLGMFPFSLYCLLFELFLLSR